MDSQRFILTVSKLTRSRKDCLYSHEFCSFRYRQCLLFESDVVLYISI